MRSKRDRWFKVDAEGFRALHADREPWQLVKELIANAWDEEITICDVWLGKTEHSLPGCLTLSVEDDAPEGFRDLDEARTFFRRNDKRLKPEVRGRFNKGEKEVIAVSKRALIDSVTGSIAFMPNGDIDFGKPQRTVGTLVTLDMPWSTRQGELTTDRLEQFLPPKGVEFFVNGDRVPYREPMCVYETVLETVLEDTAPNDPSAFVLRRTRRKTKIHIHRSPDAVNGMLFELGIPVCVLEDCRYLIDIQQKIPLAPDRDSVSPAYLRDVYAEVLNAIHDSLTEDDATAPWTQEALEDERLEPEPVKKVMELRFGPKRVAYDPSDREANKRAASEGYTVVHGGAMSSFAWGNVRIAGAIPPAGKVFPTPKPFEPGAPPIKLLDESEWTPTIKAAVDYLGEVGENLLFRMAQDGGNDVAMPLPDRDKSLRAAIVPFRIIVANDPEWTFTAAFGRYETHCAFTLNHAKMANVWGSLEDLNMLLLHEIAHSLSDDHLSSDYHTALCRFGAKLVGAALINPEVFRLFLRYGRMSAVLEATDAVIMEGPCPKK